MVMNKKIKHTEVFQSFNIIVFGGDGDLAFRKIYPALFHRDQDQQLLCPYNIVAITRKNPAEFDFHAQLIHFLNGSKEREAGDKTMACNLYKVKMGEEG